MADATPSVKYHIASLKHTNRQHEHIIWWGRMGRGYTPVIGDYVGSYVYGEALDLNDGFDCLAVPVDAVLALHSPEPHFRLHQPQRFYDQRGPVVDNTRANWNQLIAASLQFGRIYVPKPQAFRGKRVSFAREAAA